MTEYQYDEAGNKVAQIDTLGRVTHWEYDARGRVTARELPLGQRELFAYDQADNVATHTNFNGQVLTYSYETTSSRLVLVTGPDIRETYTYDKNGNRTYAKNHSGEYTYAYDSRNRLIEETQPNGSTLSYTYDDAGNKLTFTLDYANGDSRTESYAYDALNRLVSVTDKDNQTTTFDYDAVGNQTHIHYPNGLVSITEYDSLHRATTVTTKDASDNILTRYAYGLDNTGRRTSITEQTGRQSTYTYDDVYLLTNETIVDAVNGDYSADYVYDVVGNRTQRTVDGVLTEYQYDANDRLLSEGINTYTYDGQGNVLEQTDGLTTKTYQYNANQRLMQFDDGIRAIDFTYNVDNIRVAKSVDGTSTDFIVDSNQAYQQVVAEQNASSSILKEYLYGTGLISQNNNSTNHYYHYDALGSTKSLSDDLGAISDEYNYEAFGEVISQTGTTDNDYLYTGEQYDAELDNYYLRARYYDQNVGRFTQMDEWMGKDCTPPTLNKFLYTHSDPINGTDPTGFMTLSDFGVAQEGQALIRSGTASARVFSTATGKSKNLVKKVGCFIGNGFIQANRFSGSQGHHPIQQSLGGAFDQNLLYVMQKSHSMLHTIQNLLFREAGFPPLNSTPDVWAVTLANDTKAQAKVIKLMLKSAVIVDRFCGYKSPLSFTSYLKTELRAGKLIF